MTGVPDGGTCPRCGGHPTNLRPPGRQRYILDTDLRALRELLDGEIDADRCDRCGGFLPVAPTVFVLLPADGLVLYAAGPLLEEAETAPEDRDWCPALGQQDAVPHVVRLGDLDQLRRAAQERLVGNLAGGSRLAAAMAPKLGGRELRRHWRELTPRLFVAAALASAGQLSASGPDLELLTGLTGPAGADWLDRAQLRVWQAMAAEWTGITAGQPTGGVRLQDDLDGYVLGRALSGELEWPEEPEHRDGPVPAGSASYAWLAVGAALARSLGRPNPAARAWAESYIAHEVGCALRPGGPIAGMVAARVSAEFASATVPYGAAWDAAAALLGMVGFGRPDFRLPAMPLRQVAAAVGAAAARAGHPQLLHAVLEARLTGTVGPGTGPDDIVTTTVMTAGQQGWDPALVLAGALLDALPAADRDSATDRVAVALSAAAEPAQKPRVLVWWARRLLRGRRFCDAQRLIAEHPLDEDRLATPLRARWWGVRAATLMGAGRFELAAECWRRIVDLLDRHVVDLRDDADLRPWALVNLSDTLEASGAPDEAFAILGELISPGGYGPDPELLVRRARLSARFGDAAAAVAALVEAAELAGPGRVADRCAIMRAQVLTELGRDQEAVGLLIDLAPRGQAAEDHAVLLAEAAAWATLIRRGTALPAGAAERVGQLPALLAERARRAGDSGDRTDQVALLTRSAELVELLGADAGPLWSLVLSLRRRHGLAEDPELLVRTARARFAANDPAGMRELLVEVPAALGARYGAIPDIGLLADEPAALLRPLAELAGALFACPGSTVDDVRLIADLQRDAIGRARAGRLRHPGWSPPRWSGAVRTRIPSDAQPIAVLEWIRTGSQSLRCLLTRVNRGQEQVAQLRIPAVDPIPLRQRLLGLLNEWPPGAPGSPLDTPGWSELSTGLLEELSQHLQPDDHLVFLHSAVFNLPWHLAVRDRWTVSYATGWSQLLALLGGPATRPRRLGTCVVPRARDRDATLAALAASARAAEQAAIRAGVDVRPLPAAPADRDGLAALLADVDLAVMLCHGFQHPGGTEVGWVLAHDGELPPADAVTMRRVGGAHVFGWRDCSGLPRAAPIVLSAACATGHAYDAGLGDRFGLFSALRHAGTATMVAPAWDVVVDDVLPVLDELLVGYLDGRPLGQALRAACAAAAVTTPPWQAWALALEGDWR